MTDYEKAAQNAFQHIFPNAQLNRYFFHLAQSVYRKVQEFGLQQQYADNANLRMKIKMLPSLALLPPNDVIDAFENIPFSDATEPVISYFEDTYTDKKQRGQHRHPMFSINVWNIHVRAADGMPRTNNSMKVGTGHSTD